jgi:hypothetical protein
MFTGFDESELLALIEGELAPEDAAALRARLAESPGALAAVDAILADRAALRREPEPALPRDFLADFEHLLARPMLLRAFADAPTAEELVIAAPGEFRRAHRRPIVRRRLRRSALLAAAVMLAGGAAWLAIRNDVVSLPRVHLAWSGGAAEDSGRAEIAAAEPSARWNQPGMWPPGPDAVVHHHLPRTWPGVGSEPPNLAASPAPAQPRAAQTDPRPVEIVLAVHGADAASVERDMERLVAQLGAHAALVQNFSYEEARKLEAQWLASRSNLSAPGRPPQDVRAGSRADRHFAELAQRASQQSASSPPAGAGNPAQTSGSRQLVGQPALAASLVQQLDYSSRGATHTVTLRLADLHRFLAAMHERPGLRTALAPLPHEPAPGLGSVGEQSEAASWAERASRLQELLAEIEAAGEDALILLPITVEQSPPNRRAR